jgi:transglutaminase-like putative cysteine protease
LPVQHSTWAEQVPLLDYRTLDWNVVRRTHYFCYQRFHYAYPGPIRNLHQQLIVVPPDVYADQTLSDQKLTVAPHPATSRQRFDRFGNRVWELHVRHIDREIAFEVISSVERATDSATPWLVDRADAEVYLQPTQLTLPDERIRSVAAMLASEAEQGEPLAEAISTWVADAFRYTSGATGVQTTAAQALGIGAGLCQDYAHVMLAICRAAGLPARYISGHMLAEGGSHAWVEVLLPTTATNKYRVCAFDPTNRRRPNLSYCIVAVGRDYRDVPPTSGSFSAPYGGHLSFTKRAGLTAVELMDGQMIDAAAK